MMRVRGEAGGTAFRSPFILTVPFCIFFSHISLIIDFFGYEIMHIQKLKLNTKYRWEGKGGRLYWREGLGDHRCLVQGG